MTKFEETDTMTQPEAQTHWKCSDCSFVLQAERSAGDLPHVQGAL